MSTRKRNKKPSGSNPIAKNMWKQNKPKVQPDPKKQHEARRARQFELNQLLEEQSK